MGCCASQVPLIPPPQASPKQPKTRTIAQTTKSIPMCSLPCGGRVVPGHDRSPSMVIKHCSWREARLLEQLKRHLGECPTLVCPLPAWSLPSMPPGARPPATTPVLLPRYNCDLRTLPVDLFTLRITTSVLADVAQGLRTLYEKTGHIHGDVAPSNVCVYGQPRLAPWDGAGNHKSTSTPTGQRSQFVRGVVIDLDCAVYWLRPSENTFYSSEEPPSRIAFGSLAYHDRDEPMFRPGVADDLEALLYVAAWCWRGGRLSWDRHANDWHDVAMKMRDPAEAPRRTRQTQRRMKAAMMAIENYIATMKQQFIRGVHLAKGPTRARFYEGIEAPHARVLSSMFTAVHALDREDVKGAMRLCKDMESQFRSLVLDA